MSFSSTLPWEITISTNPRKAALKYFGVFFVSWVIVSFAFSDKIPYGTLVGNIAIVAGGVSIWLVARSERNKKKTIEISEEGILETRRGTEIFIGWAEPHQTYISGTNFTFAGILPVGSASRTQVVAKGKRIVIDYPVNAFHTTILELSYRGRLPLVKEQLANGMTINFGPIDLDGKNIYVKGKSYPRENVKGVNTEHGEIVLRLKKEWFATKLHVSDVPDVTCLISLLNRTC